MLVHCRVTPSIKFAGTHLYTWAERGAVRVTCPAQEHNTMSPARARTWTARSGVELTNREATAPPTLWTRICTAKQTSKRKNVKPLSLFNFFAKGKRTIEKVIYWKKNREHRMSQDRVLNLVKVVAVATCIIAFHLLLLFFNITI